MTIRHAYASPNAAGFDEAYVDTLLLRAASVEYDLNRSDRGPHQIVFVFTQMDTYIPVSSVGP